MTSTEDGRERRYQTLRRTLWLQALVCTVLGGLLIAPLVDSPLRLLLIAPLVYILLYALLRVALRYVGNTYGLGPPKS